MLTSLSQFQAQGWEKWLSRIKFTRGTNPLLSRWKAEDYGCWENQPLGTSFLIKIALTILRNKTLQKRRL
jgi:hypothetical protein